MNDKKNKKLTPVDLDAYVDYIDKQHQRIKQLENTLNSAGEWISSAAVSIEPGWAGSKQDILDEITRTLHKEKLVEKPNKTE